jgi:hypothetical protein
MHYEDLRALAVIVATAILFAPLLGVGVFILKRSAVKLPPLQPNDRQVALVIFGGIAVTFLLMGLLYRLF